MRVGAAEVEAFLSDLAVNGQVAAATQNQALSALLFLYREVLGVELPWLEGLTRAKRPQRLPVVLTPAEVRAVLDRMDGVYGLMARLLYGTGMRLMECVRLRVKDVDFGRNEILIRDGKGAKDRMTMLPAALAGPLQAHLARRRLIYEDDLRSGLAAVWLPDALARKYPNGRWASLCAAHPRTQGALSNRKGAARSPSGVWSNTRASQVMRLLVHTGIMPFPA